MLQRKSWEYTGKSDVKNRDVMMAIQEWIWKICDRYFKKIRCLPGHEPIV